MPINNVKLGNNVVIPYPDLVNLYDCEIGDDCFVGPFVEVQKDVCVGKRTRIQSHSFICSKVRIGDDVFIGHGVMFINDRYPVRKDPKFWEETIIKDKVIVGSNATILPCTIEEGVTVGAGAVVTKNVEKGRIVVGNPGKVIGDKK